MKEVMFYEKGGEDRAFCRVCPHMCRIGPGKRGVCRVRENRGGLLYATNYGRVTSYAMDPIEKKPLYHFYPGSLILSLGTVGCNLGCGFCQNWEIAHGDPSSVEMSPHKVVEDALGCSERGMDCMGIAYTYSEPLMWYEFVYDTSRLAAGKGLKNVLVTNGYINGEPLKELLPFIHAMNIDVKGFTEEYYRDSCKGRLAPVIKTVEEACSQCHVEITTLLVPGRNDSREEITGLAQWLAGLDRKIPLHFSRYFPNYRYDLPPTPGGTLAMARDIAREYLDYVYIGNAPELDGGKTLCPDCGNVLVERRGYRTSVKGLKGGVCSGCGRGSGIIEHDPSVG